MLGKVPSYRRQLSPVPKEISTYLGRSPHGVPRRKGSTLGASSRNEAAMVCPVSRHNKPSNETEGFSVVPLLCEPVSRRTALRRGGTVAGALAALGTLNMLGDLARIPVRKAW